MSSYIPATEAARKYLAEARQSERIGINLSASPAYALSAGFREAGLTGVTVRVNYAAVVGDMVAFDGGPTLHGATGRAFQRGYAAAAVSGEFSAHNAEMEALKGLRAHPDFGL